ncbi:MAG: hypothetical protein HKN03_18865 [Acidimicrobiales bacterium]|nr:hypothetical protein [Acidimicrobiales bacterium]
MSGTIVHDVNRDGSRDGGEPGLGTIPVIATLFGPDGVPGTTDDVSYSTVTADDGSWSFADISAGNYVIEIDPSGVPHGLSEVSFSTRTVYLPPGSEMRILDAGLVGTSELSNVVFDDLNQNGAQDGQETGVPDLSITARWFGPDSLDGTADDAVYSAVTDAQGAWGIQQIPAGTYAVTIDSATLPSGLSGTPSVTTAVAPNATAKVVLPVSSSASVLAFTGGGALNLVLVGLVLLLTGSGAIHVAGSWRRRAIG